MTAYPAITVTPPRYLPSRYCPRLTGLERVSRMVPRRISADTAVPNIISATRLPPNELAAKKNAWTAEAPCSIAAFIFFRSRSLIWPNAAELVDSTVSEN